MSHTLAAVEVVTREMQTVWSLFLAVAAVGVVAVVVGLAYATDRRSS